MGAFVLRRMLWTLFKLWIVSMIIFVIFFILPEGGGREVATRIAGKNPTEEQIALIMEKFYLDRPVPVRYSLLMRDMLTGEIVSFTQGTKVVPQAISRLPVTFSMAMFAAVIWLSIGIAIGNKGARAPGSRLDRALTIIALTGISLPIAWLSLYMLYFFTDVIPIFPPGDYVEIAEGGIFRWAWHLLLPGATLAVLHSGVYGRITRSSVRTELAQEYIKTAVAKGLPDRTVHRRHVLRVALIPIVVMFGLDFGALLGGAIFTESIFGVPGLGHYMMTGIATQDLPILMVCALIGAAFVMTANVIVDVAQAAIDPRIRLG